MSREINSRSYTFDKALALHLGVGAVASLAFPEGVGQVDGNPAFLDLGSETATFSGTAIIDVSVVTGENSVFIQGSDTEDFSGDVVNLATVPVNVGGGHLAGANVDAAAGDRYEAAVFNDAGQRRYQYIRANKVGGGDLTASVYLVRANGAYMP